MMALVRTWLLGVTAAAILAALADALMPEGGVKQAGRLVCGLVLLCAVLRPLGSVNVTEISGRWEYDSQELQRRSQELREETEAQMKTVIEQRLSAYSMDKAEQLGFPCRIAVTCRREEGTFLPEGARITGVLEPWQRQGVEELLTRDLGLPPEALDFREEGAA